MVSKAVAVKVWRPETETQNHVNKQKQKARVGGLPCHPSLGEVETGS